MGGQLSPVQVDHVGPDNTAVGYTAGRYLLDKGLRELAYLTTEPSWDFSKLRAQGFIAAAQEAGVEPTMYVRKVNGSASLGLYGRKVVTAPDLHELVRRLVSRIDARPLGLFVTRDEETVQVYRILRDLGVEPGKDVTVISCDCDAVRLSTLHPQPPSIDLEPCEIARHAIRRLITRLKHRDEPPARILISPRLVECTGEIDRNGKSSFSFE